MNGLSFSAGKHYIHSVVKVFKNLITFLNYPGFVPNLDRSLFMIIILYPEVKFVKRLLSFFCNLLLNGLRFSCNHKIVHVTRGIFLLIFSLIFVEPAIYSKSRRDTGFRGTLTIFFNILRLPNIKWRTLVSN